ncbi:hypothetical protein N8264_04325 [Candidatus Thioglobus sp.]|nr:hypothetical protein [Candidatus Thioglobus sp.]
MKKLIQIFLLSFGLIGCSSIDYAELTSSVSPSDTEVNRILALGLTHTENLILARKITNSSVASTVVNELENRKTKTDNENIDAERASNIADLVKISDGNSKFFGPQISKIKKRNMVGKPENFDYFLLGLKDNNSLIQHTLSFSITHTSEERRDYTSASFCDKWQGCSNDNHVDITVTSVTASDCSSFECNYTEKMELSLSDDFLRSYMKDGLSVSFNSKAANNKATFSPFYLEGYLSIAN